MVQNVSEENDQSKVDMSKVTIPVDAGRDTVYVTLTYPKGPYDSEAMENVLGVAIQELHRNPALVENFVASRTKFQTQYVDNVKELELHRQDMETQLRLDEEKTKRWGIVLSSCLVALGLVLILFYPDGRENLVYPIAATLFVIAAGTFGYKRLWGKMRGFEGGLERDLGKD